LLPETGQVVIRSGLAVVSDMDMDIPPQHEDVDVPLPHDPIAPSAAVSFGVRNVMPKAPTATVSAIMYKFDFFII